MKGDQRRDELGRSLLRQALGGDQDPRAVTEVGLLDPQAEPVLRDRLDRHRDLVAAEGRDVPLAELVCARVGVPGRD